MMRKLSTLTILSLLPLAWASAQSQEPEWRVTNPYPPRVIPLYNGQPNPFPYKIEEAAPVIQISDEALAAAEAERTLNKLRSNAEDAVRSGNALLPDTSKLSVGGYLKGARGEMVLMNGNWYGVGQKVRVPSIINPETIHRLESLKGVDDELMTRLATQLDQRRREEQAGNLTLHRITAKEITFKGPLGLINLPLRQREW